jgi:hypothetical protein
MEVAFFIAAIVFVVSLKLLAWALAAHLARRKGRRVAVWLPLAVLFNWLTVLVLALPSQRSKRCPRCAEKIWPEARVCRFCGHEFEEKEMTTTPLPTTVTRAAVAWLGAVCVGSIAAMLAIGVLSWLPDGGKATAASPSAAQVSASPSAAQAERARRVPDDWIVIDVPLYSKLLEESRLSDVDLPPDRSFFDERLVLQPNERVTVLTRLENGCDYHGLLVRARTGPPIPATLEAPVPFRDTGAQAGHNWETRTRHRARWI